MSEAVDKLAEVEEYIESLKSEIADAEAKLTELKGQIADAVTAKDKAEVDRDTALQAAADEQQRLKTEADAQKKLLLTEQETLEEKVADLKRQTAEMLRKIADFKEYEARAMQVLKTKEASLLDREKAVREKEALSPFLPER